MAYIIWFACGVFLFISRAIVVDDISKYWNKWVTSDYENAVILDVELLNLCVAYNILFEVIPSFIIVLLMPQENFGSISSVFRFFSLCSAAFIKCATSYAWIFHCLYKRQYHLLNLPLKCKVGREDLMLDLLLAIDTKLAAAEGEKVSIRDSESADVNLSPVKSYPRRS